MKSSAVSIRNDASHGTFSGEPEARWLTERKPDRNMTLLAEFWFDDPKPKRWTAPAGYVVDGASIPRALWTLVGSPYAGDYRRASIPHDKACRDAGGDHAARRKADKMFYHACRAGNCPPAQALLLYLGVRLGSIMATARLYEGMEGEEPTARLELSPWEQRLIADYQIVGTRLQDVRALDDIDLIEKRVDEELERLYPEVKQRPKTKRKVKK